MQSRFKLPLKEHADILLHCEFSLRIPILSVLTFNPHSDPFATESFAALTDSASVREDFISAIDIPGSLAATRTILCCHSPASSPVSPPKSVL